jgi:hypothetical protein
VTLQQKGKKLEETILQTMDGKSFCLTGDWCQMHKEELVNRSEMDVKRNILTWEKTFISQHILHQH